MRNIWVMALSVGLLAAPVARAADPASPVGEWRTIDDATHEPKAVIRIFEQGGALYGVVEKSLLAVPPARKTCDQCSNDRKDKPILGMDIIRGLRKDGDQWDGGTILDPEQGKIYKCKMSLQPGGQKLEVRGYIGISLLGRTQTWERVS